MIDQSVHVVLRDEFRRQHRHDYGDACHHQAASRRGAQQHRRQQYQHGQAKHECCVGHIGLHEMLVHAVRPNAEQHVAHPGVKGIPLVLMGFDKRQGEKYGQAPVPAPQGRSQRNGETKLDQMLRR